MALNGYFPLAEYCGSLGIDLFHQKRFNLKPGRKVMAVGTGEFRPPRKGEWYLSGAIIEAYLAKADFTHSFHIARLVVTEEVRIIKEIGPFRERG